MLVFGQKPVTDFRAVIGKVGKMKTYQSANFILSVPNTEYRFVVVGRGGEDSFQKVFLIGYGLQVIYKRQPCPHIVAVGIYGTIYGSGIFYRYFTQHNIRTDFKRYIQMVERLCLFLPALYPFLEFAPGMRVEQAAFAHGVIHLLEPGHRNGET